jgi:cytochrome c551/c552
MKKSFKLLVTAAGLMAISATASAAFSTAPCKACHAIDKVKVGPAWKDVAKAYGSADALAAVFKSGFKPADRKILNSDPKFKSKGMIMTPQFTNLIKGHEDDAAKALFDAVKAGKI